MKRLNQESQNYWSQYYETNAAPELQSKFAQYVMDKYANEGESLIELGCGNGRDALYFAKNKLDVVAVDQCVDEVAKLNAAHQTDALRFEAHDFTRMPDAQVALDAIYSRFTLHSVDAAGQSRTLDWSQRNLREGGHLYIETRGQKNEIYQLGEPVEGESDAFIYEDHYRRFVDFDEFTGEIEDNNLRIIEASEEKGYAPYKDTDYHFIRVIAQKD